MKVRNLGSVGLVSSAIGLGTLAFTHVNNAMRRYECQRTIRLALDMGMTMVDVGNFRARDEIERLLGECLRGMRADAVVATQGGMRASVGGEQAVIDGTPAYLTMICDESLRRLRTDYIDLFYLSRVDPRVPVEDSIGTLSDLVAEGKIRYLGLREATPDELRRAHATHPVSALAVEYSLRQRAAEKGSLTAAAELGVGVVACGPLGHGLLTGGSRLRASEGEELALRAIEAEAAELDLGMARLVLAWLLSWRQDVVPVPSTRNPAHLEMNASAADIRLPQDMCARLAQLFPL